MKRNEGKYPVKDKLPANAMLVKEYAKQQNVKEPAIYNRYARKGSAAGFTIIIYFERNFIVPN